MGTFVVEYYNMRRNVKAMPMESLQEVLEKACLMYKPKLDSTNFTFQFNKKLMEMDTIVRYANLPSSTKLLIVPKPNTRSNLNQQQLSKPISKMPIVTNSEKLPLEKNVESNLEVQQKDKITIKATNKEQEITKKDNLVSLEPNRELIVYHRDDVLRKTEKLNLTDDFFEFKESDYHKLASSYNNKEEVTLKTKSMRDKEKYKKAKEHGPIEIRLTFPDGMVCQCKFEMTERVSDVIAAVQELIDIKYKDNIIIFIAPPKTELKDKTLMLYDVGLISSSNIYVSEKNGNKNLLKDEILVKKTMPPKIEPIVTQEIVEEEINYLEEKEEIEANNIEIKHSERKENKKGKLKFPKWLKL